MTAENSRKETFELLRELSSQVRYFSGEVEQAKHQQLQERRDGLSLDKINSSRFISAKITVWESLFLSYLPAADALARDGAPECWEYLANILILVRSSGKYMTEYQPATKSDLENIRKAGFASTAQPENATSSKPLTKIPGAPSYPANPNPEASPKPMDESDPAVRIFNARQTEQMDIRKDALEIWQMTEDHYKKMTQSRSIFFERVRDRSRF